jgi:hypothetical protein
MSRRRRPRLDLGDGVLAEAEVVERVDGRQDAVIV